MKVRNKYHGVQGRYKINVGCRKCRDGDGGCGGGLIGEQPKTCTTQSYISPDPPTRPRL